MNRYASRAIGKHLCNYAARHTVSVNRVDEELVNLAKPIQWSSAFEVGVDWLDADHRGLADALNRFHRSCYSDGSVENLRAIVDEIISLLKAHFEKEEEFLNEVGLLDKLHKEDHEQNLVLLDRVRSSLSDGFDDSTSEKAYVQLANAFVQHVVGMDCGIKAYFDDRKV